MKEDNRHNCSCCVGIFYSYKQRFSLIVVHLCLAECKGHSGVPVFVVIF